MARSIPELEPERVLEEGAERETWKREVVERLLEELVHSTRSGVAAFRTWDAATKKLILECFSVNETLCKWLRPRQGGWFARVLARLLGRSPFRIPKEKGDACGQGRGSLQSWGMVSYSRRGPQQEDLRPYTKEERAFLRWRRQKAWFPIALGSGAVGLIGLVRGHRSPYAFDQAVTAWVEGQKAISRSLRGRAHKGFVAAAEALPVIESAPDRSTLLQAVIHCLASHRGLGWNRVWILAETMEAEGTFRCLAALGEVSDRRWKDATETCERQPTTLQEELFALFSERGYREDLLFLSCCTPGRPLSLAMPADGLLAQFVDEHPENPVRCFGLVESFRAFFPSAAGEWEAALRQRARGHGHEYLEDPDVFFLPLFIGQRRYLALLSQVYSHDTPSAVLTTAFLHAAALVVGEWHGKHLAAIEEEEDAALSAEEEELMRATLRSRLDEFQARKAGEQPGPPSPTLNGGPNVHGM